MVMETMEFTTETTISWEYRPCIICGELKALFHQWEQYATTVPAEITIGGAPGGQVEKVYGIVELESGYMRRIEATDICFLDSPDKFGKYDFQVGQDGGERQ